MRDATPLRRRTIPPALLALSLVAGLGTVEAGDVGRLVAAMDGETPIVDDLRSLTDEVGGRPTGSSHNERAVAWALERFAAAGVEARSEAFAMPALWLETSASASIRSADGGVVFEPQIAAMPFSTAAEELTAPLVDGGYGTDADFARLAESATAAMVLIDTDELTDIDGLFKEYEDAFAIDMRAEAAGAAGLVYVGSRPRNVLHRHKAPKGPANDRPMVAIERDAGRRALRLLRKGTSLEITLDVDVETGGGYESFNVIGEIRGSSEPEEFVVLGAHLDSWGLGTGALDNGCNVALVIDVARQIRRLGLTPRRTIRFALWNGEEQGLHGSQGYTLRHADELDRHVMASSYDIGSGRIVGFFTGGRPELAAAAERAVAVIADRGPFEILDVPIVGTDNYDFMIQGVGNLVANQESANYGPNYHAETDTFDRVDLEQLKRNAAIAAAVTWQFASMDVDWKRQSRAEIEQLMESTDLPDQMRMFAVWSGWEDGSRARAED